MRPLAKNTRWWAWTEHSLNRKMFFNKICAMVALIVFWPKICPGYWQKNVLCDKSLCFCQIRCKLFRRGCPCRISRTPVLPPGLEHHKKRVFDICCQGPNDGSSPWSFSTNFFDLWGSTNGPLRTAPFSEGYRGHWANLLKNIITRFGLIMGVNPQRTVYGKEIIPQWRMLHPQWIRRRLLWMRWVISKRCLTSK